MTAIIKSNQNVRTIANEVAVETERQLACTAYDHLREAIFAGNRKRLAEAIPIAETVNIGELKIEIEQARQVASKLEIVFYVTKLAGVMKQFSGALDLDAYLEQLVDDLRDERATLIGLALGCRAVRQSCKTFPSIAEVLEAVRAVESDFRSLSGRLETLPDRIAEAKQMIAFAEGPSCK